jgi:hypothetical protein
LVDGVAVATSTPARPARKDADAPAALTDAVPSVAKTRYGAVVDTMLATAARIEGS